MKIKPIIDQLKASAPALGGRVAGSAEFNEAVEAARLDLPCAFVFRMGGEATPGQTLGRTTQVRDEDFAVMIAVDNSADERGQAAAESLDDVLGDVLAALLGWEPGADHNAFEYVRDEQIAMDRARLWHQISFRCSSVISN